MKPLADAATATIERPEDDAAALYELYRQRIRQYCYGQLRDRQEAEDALQTTFLYAFTLLQRGTKPKRPLPWLYTIAHNVCRTRRRALKRRTRIESGVDLETLHESVGRNDPPREDVAQLASLMATLPSAQREALLLREWQGLSYTEIAQRLDLTESAVEAVLFRARRSLARTLRPAGERIASVMNGVLLLPLLRRLAPFGNSTKLTTAALVAGAAAATPLLPLADTPTRGVPREEAAPHVTRPHVTRPHAAAAAAGDVARQRVVTRHSLHVPAAPVPQPAALPTPHLTPASPATPPQQQTAEPAVSAATAAAPTPPVEAEPPKASAGTTPAPPPPAAPTPPPVQTVVATAGSATDVAASTSADAVSAAASTVDAVTSGVESTVDSTVSSVTAAVTKLPLPTSTPLQSHP